jgi:hypothetical protein
MLPALAAQIGRSSAPDVGIYDSLLSAERREALT